MRVWIGTSGFQYTEWKGSFYPPDLPPAKMLPFYAERFSTTEINYTFHRIPAPKTIENWCALTPNEFRFALKAPQKVTHFAKLRNCADTVDYFHDVACGLGERMGPVLFQLPPQLTKDAGLLENFCEQLPASVRAAFEFRHPSWFAEDTYSALGRRNCALCLAETAELQTPVRATADWAYLRLRREDYTPADLEKWAGLISANAQGWREIFAYFKHEESGMGPKLASELQDLLNIVVERR